MDWMNRLKSGNAWLYYLSAVILAVISVIVSVSPPSFFQDDAYISFRYLENFRNGNGLVFNAGERVEGYSNFLWIILLSLISLIESNPENSARFLGILSAAAATYAGLFLAKRAFDKFESRWTLAGAIGAGLWIAVNPAVSYWAVAGLETTLFLLLITLAVERLLSGSPLGWGLLVPATLTRPEGGLVFIVCYILHILNRKPGWWQPLAIYILPLIPFAAFKLIYYGSLFPNPFFAKTGFTPEYWRSGIDYLWLFLRHFGLWGILLVPMAFAIIKGGTARKLSAVIILWTVYAVYIVAVGGDVLRAHRFFAAVWPLFAVGAIGGIIIFFRSVSSSVVALAAAGAVILGIGAYQYYYPSKYFSESRAIESSFVRKMALVAGFMDKTDRTDLGDHTPFSVAASTIGRLGYDLMGHTIIDMLGLTDSTIARHPESIPGMETTWKERHFNASYVLSRDPDYILFSTGYKPSSPAERALFMHSKFRQNYYYTFYRKPGINKLYVVYKRKGDFNKPDSVWHDIEMADDINIGIQAFMENNLPLAYDMFADIKANGPGDFDLPDHFLAGIYYKSGQFDMAIKHCRSALKINPNSIGALLTLGEIYRRIGEPEQADAAMDSVLSICPWLAGY